MPVPIKCMFCDQTFDFDNSTGSLLATCPRCGKQNTAAVPSGMTQRLRLLRNAPTSAGGKPCPKCKAQIELDAAICVHCGCDLATGRKTHGARIAAGRKKWIGLGVAVLLLMAAGVIYSRRPPAAPAIPPVEVPPAVSAPPPVEPAAPLPAEPQVRPPAAPPAPPQMDARALFEAQKAKEEQLYRQKLGKTAPLYKLKDSVELRRKNGQIVRGTLLFVGRGTNRIVIVATEEGKAILPMKDLDGKTRIQLDPQARENHIRDRLNLQTPAPTNRPQATK